MLLYLHIGPSAFLSTGGERSRPLQAPTGRTCCGSPGSTSGRWKSGAGRSGWSPEPARATSRATSRQKRGGWSRAPVSTAKTTYATTPSSRGRRGAGAATRSCGTSNRKLTATAQLPPARSELNTCPAGGNRAATTGGMRAGAESPPGWGWGARKGQRTPTEDACVQMVCVINAFFLYH